LLLALLGVTSGGLNKQRNGFCGYILKCEHAGR
jgi:hypothetical protein